MFFSYRHQCDVDQILKEKRIKIINAHGKAIFCPLSSSNSASVQSNTVLSARQISPEKQKNKTHLVSLNEETEDEDSSDSSDSSEDEDTDEIFPVMKGSLFCLFVIQHFCSVCL